MYSDNWLPDVFNSLFNQDGYVRSNRTAPAVNVLETKDDYIVELAAPGLRKEDFDVTIDNDGNLAIKMENHHQNNSEARYLRREFSYSTFEQTIILPDEVDRTKISARVADGILTITLPKLQPESQKVSRQIEIG